MNNKAIKTIFVTVGTTNFNELIKKVDDLIANKIINDKVIMQIGGGSYIPKYAKYFRFITNIDKYYQKADLVISHEGAATLFRLMELNKKIIALENPKSISNPDLIRKFSKEKYILWCKDIEKLNKYIKRFDLFKPQKYIKPKCEIHLKIIEFLIHNDNSN